MNRRTDIKEKFRSIPSDKFADWLGSESTGLPGVGLLTLHIKARFPEATTNEAAEYAFELIGRSMRFSRGLVRSDLYYNWRCACRGSVPKDLIDDMYQVLDSVYCDVYATGKSRQAEYAPQLLTSNTKTAIYGKSMAVDEWVQALA